MDAVVAKTSRRIPSDSVDPTVKNFHGGDLTKSLYEAYGRGANQALLLDHEGNRTEGPNYNLFAVIEGALAHPGQRRTEGNHAPHGPGGRG